MSYTLTAKQVKKLTTLAPSTSEHLDTTAEATMTLPRDPSTCQIVEVSQGPITVQIPLWVAFKL